MVKNRFTKTISCLLAAAVLCTLPAGCGTGGNTSVSDTSVSSAEAVAVEFASFFLPMDEDAAVYEAALDAAADYLNGELSQEEALEKIADSEAELAARQETAEEYAADEAMEELFDECGISAAEAEILANYRLTEISSFISHLESLSGHIQYADQLDFAYEAAQVYYTVYSLYLDGLKGYYYYCLNEFFVDWDADDVSFITDEIIENLKCYLPDGYAWETDTDVIENKIDLYLDEMEQAAVYAQEYYGDSYSYTLDTQDAYERMVDLIERRQELESRISELSAAIEEAQETGASMDELWEEYYEIEAESTAITEEWAALIEEYPWLDTTEE